MRKKDLVIGVTVGFFIGVLVSPLFKATQPELYDSVNVFILPFFLLGTPIGLFIAQILSKKIPVIWQISKFGVIGILNTLVDWGILALLPVFIGISFESSFLFIGALTITYYSLYKGMSFLIAVVNSYFWNKYWVFEGKRALGHKEFIQFLVISGIGFFINVGLASAIFITVSVAGLFTEQQSGILGAAFATIISMVWNFLGYKLVVFKQ